MFYTMNLVDGPVDTRKPFILHLHVPSSPCCSVVHLSLLISQYLHFQSSWHFRVHSDIHYTAIAGADNEKKTRKVEVRFDFENIGVCLASETERRVMTERRGSVRLNIQNNFHGIFHIPTDFYLLSRGEEEGTSEVGQTGGFMFYQKC